MNLSQIREQAGRSQVALDAHELDHGCRPKPGPIMERHNELLRQNIAAKSALVVAEALLTGAMNFHPGTPKKTTSTTHQPHLQLT